MKSKTYHRLVNITAVFVVASVFAYGSLGEYRWVALAIGTLGGLVSAIAYLVRHWDRQYSDKTCDEEGLAVVQKHHLSPTLIVPGERLRELVAIRSLGRLVHVGDSQQTAVTRLEAHIAELEMYIKTMERRNWAGPKLSIKVLRETENVISFVPRSKEDRAVYTSGFGNRKPKRSLSKSDFRGALA